MSVAELVNQGKQWASSRRAVSLTPVNRLPREDVGSEGRIVTLVRVELNDRSFANALQSSDVHPMNERDMAAVLRNSITECEVAYGRVPQVSVPAEHARQIVTYLEPIAPQALYAAYIEHDPEEDLPYTAVVEMEWGERALLIALDETLTITRQVGARGPRPTWEHFVYDIGEMGALDEAVAWLLSDGD